MTTLTITRKPTVTRAIMAGWTGGIIDHRTARERFAELRRSLGMSTPYAPLMSDPDANAKVAKNETPTISFTGMPAATSGLGNACPASSPGCRDACIRYAGRLVSGHALAAGQARMELLVKDPDAAISLIYHETLRAAEAAGGLIGLRLNVVTDIEWERVFPVLMPAWRAAGVSVQAYDYTADWGRRVDRNEYRLTYSAKERHSVDEIRQMVDAGLNVAVPFQVDRVDRYIPAERYPETWHGMRVLDGDASDYRWNDPAGVIVALYAKGRGYTNARKTKGDTTGFIRTLG